MKRALRVIIPLILVLAVLGCLAWYLLVYDQAFTKDMLLWGARKFEDAGNYNISSWLYDVAYQQSSQEDAVAIELANQYRDHGNYTKAEFTLSEAIAANPSADLFVALCGIYVEQDKLLDAVNMLDTIADPAIRAELDAQRPAAPQFTPEPGFYSQYITVCAQADSGTLYVTANGEYPSTAQAPYSDPITLGAGETVLYALCVGENGLVSPLAISGYTVTGVIEQVHFTDSAMEAAIRAAVGADEDDVLFTDQLWDVKTFTVPEETKQYDDLALLPYLTELNISNGISGSFDRLSFLSRLQVLNITGTALTNEDMDAIAVHTGLTRLTLSDCSLSSIAVLEPLTELTYLDLSENTVRNITPLSGMTKLQELYLNNNAVTALDAIAPLTSLTHLDISYNSVSDISTVYSFTQLVSFRAAGNRISSVGGISALQALQLLDISHNAVIDISTVIALSQLVELDVSYNQLTDVSIFVFPATLRLLNLSHNQLLALPQFTADSQLVSIDASYNLISDVTVLTGLSWLNTVNMDYNPELEDLLPLDTCPVLIQVNAYGTKVTEVSFLTAKSIIVNFDPTLEA